MHMGTLDNQPPREYYRVTIDAISDCLDDLKRVAKEHNVPLDTVVRVWEIMERARASDLFTPNGDCWNEQIGGIGDIVCEGISDLAEAIREKHRAQEP
jgi:hypothetical protein